MSIPRKGARLIVVDGVSYRWSVRPRPTYSQGIGASPLSFAVMRDEVQGSTLVVRMRTGRLDSWVTPLGAPVTPAIVEQAIRRAVSAGWQAHQDGKSILLDFVDAP